ncbi:hypothetical protein [Clostridium guangxiense]|uniref:hypothetical protein n=1 Tax=Clostridium guangxiense TaxID=1662055 RepID=UPI001E52539A|nr:hypothetical protein [Clostridium guangxiense]
MLILNFIITVVLVSTASRAAITSLVLFLLIFFTIEFKKNLKKRKYLSWFLKFLWLIFFMVFCSELIKYFKNIDLSYIINDTNRLSNYTINIPILFSYNKQLFGIGAYWPALYMMYGGTPYLDSWYLYMLITCGFVGLTLSIIFIIIVAYYIFKNSKNTLLSTFTKSLFIAQLYYSVFESHFFTNSYIDSFIFWILVLVSINYKKQ